MLIEDYNFLKDDESDYCENESSQTAGKKRETPTPLVKPIVKRPKLTELEQTPFNEESAFRPCHDSVLKSVSGGGISPFISFSIMKPVPIVTPDKDFSIGKLLPSEFKHTPNQDHHLIITPFKSPNLDHSLHFTPSPFLPKH